MKDELGAKKTREFTALLTKTYRHQMHYSLGSNDENFKKRHKKVFYKKTA